jgi:hypothetical protein
MSHDWDVNNMSHDWDVNNMSHDWELEPNYETKLKLNQEYSLVHANNIISNKMTK